MGVTYSQIRRWDTGAIEAFESAMLTRTGGLEWLEEDLRRARQWDHWTGLGSDAAATGISKLGDLITDVAASAQAAKNVADRLFNGVSSLQQHVKNADALADTYGFVIRDGGTLLDLRADIVTVVGVNEAAARANAKRDLEQAVQDILRKGRELEATAAAELSSIASGKISDGGATSVGAAGASQSTVPIPPPSTDPAAVTAWWTSLADPELAARGELSELQKELIRNLPHALGPLVGVPVAARDQANDIVLGNHLDQLTVEKRMLEAQVSGREGELILDDQAEAISASVHRLNEVEERISDLHAVKAQLSTRDDLYLMQVDGLGNERSTAIIAVGDPDKAKHVAITSPGLGTTVRGAVGSMVPEAVELRNTARDLNGGMEETSAIAFLGYQAPQNVDTLTNHRAIDGAPLLAREIQGITATNQNAQDLHLTALGHSYGSDLTGIALQQLNDQGHRPVDDVVLYGSPGVMQVDPESTVSGGHANPIVTTAPPSLDEMGIDAGRGYYLADPLDPVSGVLSGALGPVPSEWGMAELSTEGGPTPGTEHAQLGPRDTPPRDLHTHSAYANKEFMSQYNMAAVVADRPEALVRK